MDPFISIEKRGRMKEVHISPICTCWRARALTSGRAGAWKSATTNDKKGEKRDECDCKRVDRVDSFHFGLTHLHRLGPEHPAVFDLFVAHVQLPLGQVHLHVDHPLGNIVSARVDGLRQRPPIHDHTTVHESLGYLLSLNTL